MTEILDIVDEKGLPTGKRSIVKLHMRKAFVIELRTFGFYAEQAQVQRFFYRSAAEIRTLTQAVMIFPALVIFLPERIFSPLPCVN